MGWASSDSTGFADPLTNTLSVTVPIEKQSFLSLFSSTRSNGKIVADLISKSRVPLSNTALAIATCGGNPLGSRDGLSKLSGPQKQNAHKRYPRQSSILPSLREIKNFNVTDYVFPFFACRRIVGRNGQ